MRKNNGSFGREATYLYPLVRTLREYAQAN